MANTRAVIGMVAVVLVLTAAVVTVVVLSQGDNSGNAGLSKADFINDDYKQNNGFIGGPEDITEYVPQMANNTAYVQMDQFELNGGNSHTQEVTLSVQDGAGLIISVISNAASTLNFYVKEQGAANFVDVATLVAANTVTEVSEAEAAPGQAVPARTFSWSSNVAAGQLTLRVVNSNTAASAKVIVNTRVDGTINMVSWTTQSGYMAGQSVEFIAGIVDSSTDAGKQGLPIANALQGVTGKVMLPDGTETTFTLAPQGVSGWYKGSFATLSSEPGQYIIEIVAQGTVNSQQYRRTQLFNVHALNPTVQQIVGATLQQQSNGDVLLVIEASSDIAIEDGDSFLVYGQLYGTSAATGQEVPVSFVNTLSDAKSGRFGVMVDSSWLALAQAVQPFQLKNVKISAASGTADYAGMGLLSVSGSAKLVARTPHIEKMAAHEEPHTLVTDEMRAGKLPPHMVAAMAASQEQSRKFLYVHGYCSSNMWQNAINGGKISSSNAVVFGRTYWNSACTSWSSSLNRERSHDEFARDIVCTWKKQLGSGKMAILAHSQGGAAATQVMNRYWSGLDMVSRGRRIQSVGTPYQGTPIGGNLAVLGKVFGVGCGKATDMTTSTGPAWMNTLSSYWTSFTYYRTTSFKDGWGWDYCQIVTDVFLSDPDDGTTEKKRGQLSSKGGRNDGHKEGWCHTADMRDTAQFYDSGKNSWWRSNAAS